MKKEKGEINALDYMGKWKALVKSQAKILPVAEGTKQTCVGD